MDTNNFDFNKLGDRISNLVDDAINSQNFKELNQTINTTINQALNGVNKTRRTSLSTEPPKHSFENAAASKTDTLCDL